MDNKIFLTGKEYKPFIQFWNQFLSSHGTGFFLQQKEISGAHRKFDQQNFILNKDITGNISRLVDEDISGFFVCLIAAFGIICKAYSNQENIVLKSPRLTVEGGDNFEAIPLLLVVSDEISLKEYLNKISDDIRQCYQYQDFKINLISDKQNIYGSNILVWFDRMHKEIPHDNYDFIFEIKKREHEFIITLKYNTALFDSYFIDFIPQHLESVLSYFNDLDIRIKDIDILSDSEQKKILFEFNDTFQPLHYNSVVELFEECAVKMPDAIAVEYRDQQLTYGKLSEITNRLANFLRKKFSLKNEDVVGLMVRRSEKLVIGLLSIFKTGATYLPIDPDYPIERRKYILDNANVKVLLTETDFLFNLDSYKSDLFLLDLQMDESKDSESSLNSFPRATDLAYLMYTSGTTGLPKGVLIEHRGLVNLVLHQIKEFGIKPGNRTLQFASISFDASLSETFKTLCSNATLVVVDKEIINDVIGFVDFLKKNKISEITLPPSYLNIIELEQLLFLRVLITAGEKANSDRAIYYSKNLNFFNAYGPTENSIGATLNRVDGSKIKSANVPIGRPITNVEVYILNSNQKLLPVGIAGELYVGGVGLARGYRNQPELTKEKFIKHPFKEGARLYRTGDIAKWLPDGTIEFMGRKDDQVKIRGYRVELGEIEHVLLKYPGVNSAVVILKEGAEESKNLVAYLVSNEKLVLPSLIKHVQENLPNYMVPGYFVQLDEMPITPNGKIDKLGLSNMDIKFLEEDNYLPPRNEVEEKLIAIWQEVLERPRIGINQDFFEIGGHSLLVVKASSRIQETFALNIPINALFQFTNVANLAEYIYVVMGDKDNKSDKESATYVIN
jgi:amino acid adenylation domain-containing protein